MSRFRASTAIPSVSGSALDPSCEYAYCDQGKRRADTQESIAYDRQTRGQQSSEIQYLYYQYSLVPPHTRTSSSDVVGVDTNSAPKKLELFVDRWVDGGRFLPGHMTYNSCGQMTARLDLSVRDNFISEERALEMAFWDRSPPTGQKSWLSINDRQVYAPSMHTVLPATAAYRSEPTAMNILGRVRLSYLSKGSGSRCWSDFWVARGLPFDVVFGAECKDKVALQEADVMKPGLGRDLRPCTYPVV
jgi:hypothetical protein